MSEQTNVDEMNKIIAAHNTVKMENEQLQKQVIEMKAKAESAVKLEAEKAEWQKHNDAVKKEIDDLKKAVDQKIVKGVASEPITPGQKARSRLAELIPTPKVDPKKYGSHMARFQHFKSPMTREFTDEQFGMALDLHHVAMGVDRSLTDSFNARRNDDIVVRRV